MIHPPLHGYTVIYSAHALKNVMPLSPENFKHIQEKIGALCTGLTNPDIKKLSLSKQNLYRLRVGNFRIIYSIDHNQLTLHIVALGSRKNVYTQMRKLLGYALIFISC